MPCRSDDHYSTGDAQRLEIDRLTQLLCEACSLLYRHDLTPGIGTSKLRKWWIDHKEKDQARRQREAAEQAKRNARSAALSKLTPEERTLLGLP